jgi:alpha/beta superfamily hydrolase
MNAPLMVSLTDSLVARSFAVLRFNFRGVGESTGEHDLGHGEMDDVSAAVTAAARAHPALAIGIAGWSFGAATALRWQARDGNRLPWVGIAPPINSSRSLPLPTAAELPPASRTVILGDRDQFATVEASETYADSIDAELHILKGSDHFFYFREEKVAELVAGGLSEEA